MREYGTPAAVEITPTANLADVAFDRAEREPQAAVFRRRAPGSGPAWHDVTAASSGPRCPRWPRAWWRPESG